MGSLSAGAGAAQLYLEEEAVNAAGAERFEDLKTLCDVGDFLGVKGGVKRTDKVRPLVFLRVSGPCHQR